MGASLRHTVPMKIHDQWKVAFWLKDSFAEWQSDRREYVFDDLPITDGLAIRAKKRSDCTVELAIDAVLGQPVTLTAPVQKQDPRGILVGVSWKHRELKLYLNGVLANTAKIS